MNIPAQSHSEVTRNELNFTVHHYKSSIYPSEDQLGVLGRGYGVVRAAVFQDLSWRFPNAVPSISRKGHGKFYLCSLCMRPSLSRPSK